MKRTAPPIFSTALIAKGAALAFLVVSCLPAMTLAAGSADGINLYKAGKFQDAVSKLESAIKANPKDVEAHYYLGLSYQYLRKCSDAVKQFHWIADSKADAKLKTDAQKRIADIAAGKGKCTAPDFSGSKPRIIEFSAEWCVPCKIFAPVYEKVKKDYTSQAEFQSVDIDDDKEGLSDKYKVIGLPMVVLVNKNGKVFYSHSGQLDEKTLSGQVKKLVAQ